MNRREFVKLAGAGMPAAALAEAVVSAQQAQTPAKSGIVAPTTSPKVKMKVGTQHGHSDAILRACAAFGVNNICSGLPSAKMDEAWSVDALVALPRARRVVRHLARHGAAADELVGNLAGGTARDLSGQEPGARPRHRRHLPVDPQLREGRHHAGEIQLHADRDSAQRHREGTRPFALQRVRVRAREAGSAADDRRQGRRRHLLGAHHLFPRARGPGGGRNTR